MQQLFCLPSINLVTIRWVFLINYHVNKCTPVLRIISLHPVVKVLATNVLFPRSDIFLCFFSSMCQLCFSCMAHQLSLMTKRWSRSVNIYMYSTMKIINPWSGLEFLYSDLSHFLLLTYSYFFVLLWVDCKQGSNKSWGKQKKQLNVLKNNLTHLSLSISQLELELCLKYSQLTTWRIWEGNLKESPFHGSVIFLVTCLVEFVWLLSDALGTQCCIKGGELNYMYKSVAKEIWKPPFFGSWSPVGTESLPCLFDSRFL